MLQGGLRTKGITKQSLTGEPLITVVTVVRNGEAALEETMLSVLNQTYRNIEYIIIDGASTDATLDIIKKYEDRIDYWQSEPDKGIYDAMNNGIDLAAGEWINFMNSGDRFYAGETVSASAAYMLKDTDAAVYYGNMCARFDYGTTIIKPRPETTKNGAMTFFNHQSSFTKTEIMKERHFNMKYKILADYDFFRSLYNKDYTLRYIPVTIARYDVREGSSINNPVGFKIEEYQINRSYGKKENQLLFVFDIVYSSIKYQIKKIVPAGIMKMYRNKKYQYDV